MISLNALIACSNCFCSRASKFVTAASSCLSFLPKCCFNVDSSRISSRPNDGVCVPVALKYAFPGYFDSPARVPSSVMRRTPSAGLTLRALSLTPTLKHSSINTSCDLLRYLLGRRLEHAHPTFLEFGTCEVPLIRSTEVTSCAPRGVFVVLLTPLPFFVL